MENDIEIRNERLQHIVGKMPSKLIQYGLYIIMCVIIFILALSYYIKIPRYYTLEGRVIDKNQINLYIQNKSIIQDIKKRCTVQILNNNEENILNTSINRTAKEIYIKNNTYLLHIYLNNSINQIRQKSYIYIYDSNSTIKLRIKTKEESLLKHYFSNNYKKK